MFRRIYISRVPPVNRFAGFPRPSRAGKPFRFLRNRKPAGNIPHQNLQHAPAGQNIRQRAAPGKNARKRRAAAGNITGAGRIVIENGWGADTVCLVCFQKDSTKKGEPSPRFTRPFTDSVENHPNRKIRHPRTIPSKFDCIVAFSKRSVNRGRQESRKRARIPQAYGLRSSCKKPGFSSYSCARKSRPAAGERLPRPMGGVFLPEAETR